MKTIMISIYKKHNENIFDTLLKTEEIRKVKPKIELPFKCVDYEPKNGGGCGKVVGEFIVDEMGEYYPCYSKIDIDSQYSFLVQRNGCLTATEVQNYGKGKSLYAWHITAPKRYENPKELGEFYRCSDGKCQSYNCKSKYCGIVIECGNLEQLTRPPQNYIKIMEV